MANELKSGDMKIGYQKVAGDYMLYIQEGNRQEFFGWFTTEGKAQRFLEKLKRWDAKGGNDGD